MMKKKYMVKNWIKSCLVTIFVSFFSLILIENFSVLLDKEIGFFVICVIFHSLIFNLILSFLDKKITKIIPFFATSLVSVLCWGIIQSFFWFIATLGYINAANFSIFVPLALGGIGSTIYKINKKSPGKTILIYGIGIICLCLLSIGYYPLVVRLYGFKNITVIGAYLNTEDKYSKELKIIDFEQRLTEVESQKLKSYIPTGALEIVSFRQQSCGEKISKYAPSVKAVIILKEPISKKVTLNQPKEGTLFYVQKLNNSFKTYPSESKTDKYVLTLEQRDNDVSIMIEISSGFSGGDLMQLPRIQSKDQ